MSSLAPQTKISFMIGKYDKDFLPPDPPVPTPLKTHLGPGAPGLRSMRGHLGPAGGEKAQNCGDTPPGHKSRDRSEKWRDETELCGVDVGLCPAGQTQSDSPAR